MVLLDGCIRTMGGKALMSVSREKRWKVDLRGCMLAVEVGWEGGCF